MNKRTVAMFATARAVGRIAVQIGWRQADRGLRNLIGSIANSTSELTVEEMESDPPLAIANYQQVIASDIIARLETLSSDELRAIAEFESTHRKRQTVLHKISQLLSTEHLGKS